MNTKLFKALDAGHTYDLVVEGGDAQRILFVKKEAMYEEGGDLKTVQFGTTNEAVISMLIDRMQVLDEKFPSDYNKECIQHLHLAYEALYARTQDREARGVEGTHQE